MKLGLFNNKIRVFQQQNLNLFNNERCFFNNKKLSFQQQKIVLSKQKIVSIVSIVFKTFTARMA